MASYAEKANLNFDILHKGFNVILNEILKFLNLVIVFEKVKNLQKLVY